MVCPFITTSIEERGTGILNNQLYVGQLIWNRVRMVKDPDTGRRVSRSNPESEWQVTPVPHLMVVDQETFDKALARKKANSRVKSFYQKRPRHLLSGLLKCGTCGSGMSTNGKDRTGRIRIRCSAASENGSCPDPKTFYLDTVERAVVSGLKAEMQHPAIVTEYVKTYHEERKQLANKAADQRSRTERRIAELDRELSRLVDGIAKGIGDPHYLGSQVTERNNERKQLTAELEAMAEPPNVMALHPATLKRYEEQLEALHEVLANGTASGDPEAAQVMRDLISSVAVRRDDSRPGGVAVEIAAYVSAFLGEKAYPHGVQGVWGVMVAEDRFIPSPHKFSFGRFAA